MYKIYRKYNYWKKKSSVVKGLSIDWGWSFFIIILHVNHNINRLFVVHKSFSIIAFSPTKLDINLIVGKINLRCSQRLCIKFLTVYGVILDVIPFLAQMVPHCIILKRVSVRVSGNFVFIFISYPWHLTPHSNS